MHSFLFELGIEELPDNVIVPAISSIDDSFKKLLQEYELVCNSIVLGSTPRRLSITVNGLPAKQNDAEVYKIGPSINIAYDDKGELSKAGLGFLHKSGAKPEDVFVEKTKKGAFVAVRFMQAGKDVKEILREWIPEAINQIPLPKKMVWNQKDLAFSRPIRWILALWDKEVLNLEYMGINANRVSYGNRYLGLDRTLKIESVQSYEEILELNKVLVNRERRRELILDQFAELFKDSDDQVKQDERLLDTVCNLIEYPHAVIGEFSQDFLQLPEKIITSTISQNQKYFSVYRDNGNLSNKFVFVSNGDPQHSNIIKAGNEKVVAARLEDAMWFFNEDCKRSLASFVPQLKNVVFQSRLGTLKDKTERILKINKYLCNELNLSETEQIKAQRTAFLCKADLVTLMLGEKEFTKLQGYMGMQYALANNEDEQVAQGIYEHYMPRGSNDVLPKTLCGALCAIADKLDTVCGIFGVGLMPTGSADPFALRRAAGGVVQILAERAWDLNPDSMIDFVFKTLSDKVEIEPESALKVKQYFKQRVSWLLKEKGFAYDIVASVIDMGLSSLPHTLAKAEALEELRRDERFVKLVIGFKRVSNILEGELSFEEVDSSLFENEVETQLHNALKELDAHIDDALKKVDYPAALNYLVDFGSIIDKFFDSVLVNCPESQIRKNRHALLAKIRAEFNRVTNLSLIVVENELNGA
ncbi:MAG: glycine--tRNA ligase subunit beta [Candidatus Cloacimonetes bacterium]|nr:glycine--tRNA ligase subunit beta [Candidatus Cloacimonadota bacterium]